MMKTHSLLTVVLCAALASVARGQAIDPATGDVKPSVAGGNLDGYKLVFSDEFNGKVVDEDKWFYRTGERLLSTQLKENVSVADGNLRLALKREKAGKLDHTAGGVISKQVFVYGYFEARFRCPKTAGWHTSFWTMHYNSVGTERILGEDYARRVERGKANGAGDVRAQEIDICEQDSVNNKSYSAGVIDWSGKSGKRSKDFGRVRYRDTTPDFAADFHVFGCEFTPVKVKFYLDGKLTHETDAGQFPHGPQQVWLTCVAVLWGDPKKPDKVDDSALPQYADFDWVRVYTKPAGASKP